MIINEAELEEWNRFMERKQWGLGTKETYGYYAKEMLGRELNQENVNKFLEKRRNNYPSFIRAFLECFNIKDIKIIYPKGRKKKKGVVDHFTQQEMETILFSIVDRRLNLMIRLMFENGLRISEVLGLQKKNFDMVNRVMKGRGKGNEEFKLPIYNKTFIELEIYLRNFEREKYIFKWDNIKNQRKKAWEVIKKEISVILPYKDISEIYPHAFRHTCGTFLRERGFDLREIQTVLRHKNLETVSYYTAIDDIKLNNKLKEVFQ
jgi:integrase